MNELRQCEEAFLNPDGPRPYRVPEMSDEMYEDLRREREMEMAEQNIDDGDGVDFSKFEDGDLESVAHDMYERLAMLARRNPDAASMVRKVHSLYMERVEDIAGQ